MTNEFDPHSPESEGQPGSLGDAFGGFMPDMPEGSWERLNERRKKRRRGLFWWLFPALLLGVGLGSYWLVQQNKAEESVVISTQPKIENAKEIPSENASAPTIENNTESKVSVPSNEKQPAVNSDESRQTENQPSEVLENQPTSDRFPKGETTKMKELEAPGLRTPSSNLVLTQAKKKRNKNATEVKSAIGTNKMTSGTVSRNESTGKIVASADVRSAKDSQKDTKGNAANRPSEKEPNANDEDVTGPKQPNSQNKIADQNSIESNHSKLEPGSVSQAVSPKDGTEPKADSVVPPKVDSTSNLATAPKDSVRKEMAKRKLGFELGLSGLYVQHQLSVQSAEQTGAEQVLQSPISVRPVFGGNLQFKMRVPIGAKFALLPLLETSVLNRQMTFQKEPGASALVKLIQTADGISGAPVLQPGTYSKETVYLLPGAGLEASYALMGSLVLRAGAVWSWVFTNRQEQKTRLIQPAYWLAAQYHLQRRWSIRTEIRRMEMSAQLLPSASSNSRNLFLGFGFVRSW